MNQNIFQSLKTKSILWREDQAKDRIDRLQKIKKWIKKNEALILKSHDDDFKKPAFETTITEILPTLSELHFICDNLRLWMDDQKVPTPITLLGHSSRIRYENKGVVLIISPWNYPFQLAVIPMLAALAAGNTVVLKPSELTAHTSDLLQKLVTDCFQNDEVFIELGAKEKTEELLTYSFDHVFFTGSTNVGRVVAKACAEKLIPVTLELGGKSPTIVDETADIQIASEKIFWGKFLNRGQTCVAPDYVIVHEKVFTELSESLKKLATLHQNDEQGEIISASHNSRLQSLAKSPVTTLTVLENPDLQSPVMQEEIFGPVLPLLSYKTDDELITLVRKYEKPLALYIFSKNKKFVQKILYALPSGGVGINSLILHLANHHLPFGGIGESGQGRYHGYFGFLEFSHQRAVIEQKYFSFLRKIMQPPYTPFKKKLLKFF